MAYGLEAYKEDGSLLFQTENITYGLLKSGPMRYDQSWTKYTAGRGTDPNDPSSYRPQATAGSPIMSISVAGAIAPVCFVAGQHQNAGSTKVGDITTFYFSNAYEGTKVYVFDIMRDLGGRTGLQCFDSSGRLSYTTDMQPLNILDVLTPPDQPAPIIFNGRPNYNNAYIGSTKTVISHYRNYNEELVRGGWLIDSAFVPSSVSGELAARLTFSRVCDLSWQISFTVGQEGCTAGDIGGVRFFFGITAFSFDVSAPGSETGTWIDIPTDRKPQALVIRTSDYPYPFR